MKTKNAAISIGNDVRRMIDKINKAKGPFCVQVSGSEFDKLKAEQEEKKMRDSNAELKESSDYIPERGVECVCIPDNNIWGFNSSDRREGRVTGFHDGWFWWKDNFDDGPGILSRIDKVTFEPIKTERQKAIEFYMGVVSAAMNSSSRGQDWGQHTRTIEALIDSGHLKLPVDPNKEL